MLLTRSSGSSLSQQVYSILQKYGTDAHVYLPGIGVINGLTAGNYLESTGITAATVDNPVGLVLDAANSVIGSELITNGSFTTDTNWTKSGGASISGGKGRLDGTGQPGNSLLGQLSVLTNGKTYKVELTIDSITGTLLCWNNDGTVLTSFTTTGTKIFYFRHAIASGNFYFCIGSGAHASVVDNVSIKEVTGIHAIQATTANKPILRRGAVNLLASSSDFNAAVWNTKTNVTVTVNQITAPDGTLTADKIEATASLATTLSRDVAGAGAASGICYSLYVKKGSGATAANLFLVRNVTTATNLAVLSFNYDTGAITQTIGSGANKTIEAEGFYRLIIPCATGVNAGDTIRVYACFTGSNETAGEFAYTWGAQLETGSTASTYIPTTTAAASSSSGNYHWVHDSTDILTATFPAGYESVTIIDTPKSGQVTLTAQNMVGAYNIGPSIDTYGRFVFKTITASELAIIQSYCNRLAGV